MGSGAIEKIISYLIGGVCGVAFGLILVSFGMPFFNSGYITDFLVIGGFLGVLVSANIFEYKKEQAFLRNQKIRDETVALITHEMRTGLTSTGWAIEIILETYGAVLQDEHKKMLQDVTKSINTTVMHSVNLLDISLLDIGKLVISLAWTKLSDVEESFKEIIEKYTIGAKQAGITLSSQINLDPKRQVEVDMLRLRIALENLLENAIQYTTGPVKTIDVNISNDTNSLHITVKDNGVGIPAAEQGKVFSEFFRASNARKMLSTGSGIGLHMCLQYVQAHHGTIRFESKENQGTTFFITLPLKSVADVNDFLTKI